MGTARKKYFDSSRVVAPAGYDIPDRPFQKLLNGKSLRPLRLFLNLYLATPPGLECIDRCASESMF